MPRILDATQGRDPVTAQRPALTAAAEACLELVGRTGARNLEIGYLHDDVPVEQAGWYAHAQYRGARITIENRHGPSQALEALARRLLTGAKCNGCGKLVALSSDGAAFYPDGHLIDGTPWDEGQIRAAGQCRWVLAGTRWEMGCRR